MDKYDIPVNLLDKVKYGLNQRNKGQYFFTYYSFNGFFDIGRFEQALFQVYQSNPKLRHKLILSDGKYKYSPCDEFKHVFNIVESDPFGFKNPNAVIEEYAMKYISQSKEAPLIALLMNADNQTLLVLLHNHIYYDGSSAYALFNQLICYYNGNQSEVLNTISDRDALNLKLLNIDTFLNIQKVTSIVSHLCRSVLYLSSINTVKKVFKKDSHKKVCYRSIILPLNPSSEFFTSNSAICAAIAKAFLAVKGEHTNQSVSISIPANFRNNDQQAVFGNLVYSFSVKLKNSEVKSMAEVMNHKSVLFRNSFRQWAAYKLFYKLTHQKSMEEIIKMFSKISNKHHFYVTNLGDFSKKYFCFFNGCSLQSACGFNFPVQENYGLIFTIVSYGNFFSVGISYADNYFDDHEIEMFKYEFIAAYNSL